MIDNTKKDLVVELQTDQNEQFGTSNCEGDTEGQQNLAMSSLLGSDVLDYKLSPAEDNTDAHRELEATLSDHCDSSSKSSLAHDEVVVSCPVNEDAINKTLNNPAEHSGSSTASDQVNHFASKVSLASEITNLLGQLIFH